MPEDGKIIALDINEKFTSLGKKYWKKAEVKDKIDLRIGNALDEFDLLIEDEKNHG